MLANRSMPRCTLIPVLAYPDVDVAVRWLCETFGFTLRLQIGSHRAQLNVGEGAIVVTRRVRQQPLAVTSSFDSVMVRVPDVDGHHERAVVRGAKISAAPADQPYGERQYSVEDFAGHHWTFSQSIADVDPTDWGGTAGQLS